MQRRDLTFFFMSFETTGSENIYVIHYGRHHRSLTIKIKLQYIISWKGTERLLAFVHLIASQ